MILDLFAGPGGWDEGLRELGRTDVVGIEWDAAACATRAAAGHRTIRADVAQYPTEPFAGKVEGLIASPPCQDFSVAGKRAGRSGERGQLIDEVPRWVEALHPEWVACEQVPPALEVWQEFADRFRSWGYSTWCGALNAADYGVPQTRKRAILLASRVGAALPPEPTHAEQPTSALFGAEHRQWVTMAEALGWGYDHRGSPTVTGGGGKAGGPEPFGNAARQALRRYVVDTRRDQRPDGSTQTFDPTERPAVTFTGKSGEQWVYSRPATTVCADPRLSFPGHHDENARPLSVEHGAIKLTVGEALVLQSFPADYPVQGTKTKRFEQIGNAVPPRLAAAVVASLTGMASERAA